MSSTADRPPIRVGILGCSDIARRRFLPALQKARNAALSAVASREREKAARLLAPVVCEVTDYEALLENKLVDMVYISLPNHLHEPWVMRALEQGKHVIGEKPLALSVSAVERMTACAERKGLLLYENMAYLHHPLHRTVKEIVAAGTIGAVRGLRASFGFMLPDADGFRRRADQGGGSYFDQARYPLSAALFFLAGGAYTFKGQALFRNGLNVAMRANATTDRDETLCFTIGFEQPYECWYEVVGDKGTLRTDRAFTTPADMAATVQVKTNGSVQAVTVPAADHFTLMIEQVCDAIGQRRGFQEYYNDAKRLARLAGQAWENCEQVRLNAGGNAGL